MRIGFIAAALLALACTRPGPGPDRSPATARLVIASTTDVHGHLRGWDYYRNAPDTTRGLARAATIVDSLRAVHPGRVLVVDAGDLLQGNPLAFVAARIRPDDPHPVIAAMNAVGYDAAAIGNHEFNYGLPLLERAIGEARFPFLAANAWTPDGRRAFPGWAIVERGGVKVGIVGATPPGSMIWDRENLRDRVVIRHIVPEVRRAVQEVRAAGAEVVVGVFHAGLDGPTSYDTVTTGLGGENASAQVAREVPGIDVIVYGHSHREMADTVIGSTLLVQAKNWATSVAVAELALERRGTGWVVTGRRGTIVPSAGWPEHPAVLAAIDPVHRATVRYVTDPIGTTPVAWRADSARVTDTPIVDFVLEVQRRAAGTQLSSTAAFALEASFGPGDITVSRLAALYPYDNTLRAVRIGGEQLRAYLEQSARYFVTAPDGRVTINPQIPGYNFDIVSGVDYTLDLSRPAGSRVVRLEYQGRAVTARDTFTLALNNYRQAGGGGFAMLSGAPAIDVPETDIRQLLIDEVRRVGVVRPEDYHRKNWRIEPASAVAQAYGAMRGAAAAAAASAGPRLRVLGTNDFHGALEPRPDASGRLRGGAAYLAGAIRDARADCGPPSCYHVLIDGGDTYQGSPASNYFSGRPVVEVYNALDYAATALGNHEFDWSVDTLRMIMREARYGILGANVRTADGRDAEWIRNDTIVQRGPWRVGIIGLALVTTPRSTRASNVAGLRFDEPAPIVDSIARALRARGADAVLVAAHIGAFCDGPTASENCRGEIVDLARALTERVDAIVSGHTHSLVNTEVNGIPITQGRQRGQALGIIDIPMDGSGPARRQVREIFSDSIAPDPRVQAIVDRAVAAAGPAINRTIATIAEPMPKLSEQYALGNLIADAQRIHGRGDVAVMNNGGIRVGLRAGPASYGDLYEIQPFANYLVRLRVRGSDLRWHAEQMVSRRAVNAHISGMTIDYDPERQPGRRVLDLRVAGRPVVDDRIYTVVMNDFLVDGGDWLGFENRALSSEPADVVDIDALIWHLQSLPQPVTPPADARIRQVRR